MTPTPNAFALKAHISSLRAAFPELDDDATLLMDTLEGETEILPALARLVEAIRERDAQARVCKDRKQEIDVRRARHEHASDKYRDLAASIMQAANLDKVRLADGTLLRMSAGAPKPIITDPAAVPQGLCKIEPSLSAIRQWVKDGNGLPAGVEMSNGGISLSIR